MIIQSSPRSLEAELRHLTTNALSTRSRYGHVALLLAALMMCVLLGALLATEPVLPGRTQVALAVMLGIGASWVVYATWVLRHRRPLLANHRVVAGWMAVVFTALFFAGASAMAVSTGGPTLQAAATAGAAMLAVAVAVLVHAYRNIARLRARRRELERQLGL
jgi:membrane associated rhomboid family serine protease